MLNVFITERNAMPHTLNTCLPLKRRMAPALRAVGVAALSLACTMAPAASVSYQATNLADVVAGQDLWQLDYTLTGPFDTFDAVNLLFASDRYASIQLLSMSPTGSLDVLLTQPDVQLGTAGQLNLSALQSLPGTFLSKVAVRLVWTDQASPGAQPFEWLDADFNVKASGMTVPTSVVPEAGGLPLMLGGLAVMWGGLERRRRARSGPASRV
jgi:hypothetical protein